MNYRMQSDKCQSGLRGVCNRLKGGCTLSPRFPSASHDGTPKTFHVRRMDGATSPLNPTGRGRKNSAAVKRTNEAVLVTVD